MHPDGFHNRHQLAALPAMNKAALLKLWDETFPDNPVRDLRKELLVPLLAYRMQEKALSGLSHAARKRLKNLAEKNMARKTEPDPPRAKLVRSWRGDVHEVFVLESGYLYQGEHFGSLSPIARKITGTQWSGPAFFGTRKKA